MNIGSRTMLAVDEELREAYPGAAFGVLAISGVCNPPHDESLESRKREVEWELRGRFTGISRADLKSLAPLDAYCAYYGRFSQTYHVLLQLESILKGKPFPRTAALVEAMFLAEIRHLLLTAGHDLTALQLPLRLAVADGTERYTMLGGGERCAVRGDMLLADGLGTVSSILRGPDHRTRLRDETRDAMFFVYAPPGVEATLLRRHLEDLERNVSLFAPASCRTSLAIVTLR